MGQQPVWSGASQHTSTSREVAGRGEPANLADILERILDKGIVIVGDIRINLLDIELLTIKIRLVVASVDRAREMGIDWWEYDPELSSRNRDVLEENRRLRERVGDLEAGRSRDGGALDAGGRGEPAAERRGRSSPEQDRRGQDRQDRRGQDRREQDRQDRENGRDTRS